MIGKKAFIQLRRNWIAEHHILQMQIWHNESKDSGYRNKDIIRSGFPSLGAGFRFRVLHITL
jgi:hypothetical protein